MAGPPEPEGIPPEARLKPIAHDGVRHWVAWLIQRLLLLPGCFFLYKLLNRYEVEGLENLDELDGKSFLICPNHTSAWDGPVTGFYVASSWARYLDPGIHWTVLADPARMVFRPVQLWCIWMGVIPVDRKAGIEQFTLQDAMRLLTAGDRKVVLGIYPEGTRSKDGHLAAKGKLGAGWLQRRSGVPVVPVYHTGYPTLPGLFRNLKVRVGKPMYLEEFQAMPDDPPTWNAVTKAIMAELRKMEADALAEEDAEPGTGG